VINLTNGVMEFSKNGGINFENLQENYQVTVAARGRT
jgi:hypothetical protein